MATSEYDYLFDSIAELETDPNCWSQPQLPNNPCPHYGNRIAHVRNFAANAWTTRIEMRVDWFNMVDDNDAVTLSDGSQLTGIRPQGEWERVLDGSQISVLRFDTDSAGSGQGFRFDRLRLCTTRAQAVDNPVTIYPDIPVTGVLQGTNDGMTFVVEASLAEGAHTGIALRVHGNSDFDLYAQCAATPNWDSQYVSNRTGPYDFIHAKECRDANGGVGSLYVAVRSYSGSGAFTLTATNHMANKDLHLRASTHFAATSSVAAGIANVLTQASKRIYGASEGRIFIESWTLDANGNCDLGCGGATCDYCFKDICNACGTGSQHPFPEILGCSTGQCTGGNWNWTYINGFVDDASNNFGASRVSTHELGHNVGGFPDEYDGSQRNQCGHTIMANLTFWQTNYCNNFNHGYDSVFGTVPDDPYSNQAILVQNGMGPNGDLGLQRTPDRYAYDDFDFAGVLGEVTISGAVNPPPAVPWGNSYAFAGLAAVLLLAGVFMASRRKEDPS